MSKFFVGQLVRVNCPESYDHNAETSIITLNVKGRSDGRFYIGHRVDTPHKHNCPPDCKGHAYEEHELIPIYDGNQKVDWESCVWKPNKEKA